MMGMSKSEGKLQPDRFRGWGNPGGLASNYPDQLSIISHLSLTVSEISELMYITIPSPGSVLPSGDLCTGKMIIGHLNLIRLVLQPVRAPASPPRVRAAVHTQFCFLTLENFKFNPHDQA